MSNYKQSIGLQTDLEPDDVLANLILSKRFNIHHVIVGEGDADIKQSRMRKYLELLSSNETILLRGQSSNNLFDQDGKEFSDLEISKSNYDKNQFISLIKKYVQTIDNPKIIFLKPPRELLETFSELKEYLAKITAYFYGGFNFRCLMLSYASERILEVLNAFKKVHIYESFFATGSDNTINKILDYQLYQVLLKQSKNNPYIDKLMQLTHLWNSSIMKDSYNTCNQFLKGHVNKVTVERIFAEIDFELSEYGIKNDPRLIIRRYIDDENDVEKFYRNWKVYINIEGHEEFQYVMADMCAVTTFFSEKLSKYSKKAKMNFDKFGNTSFTEDNDSNLYYYSGIPRKELINEMVYILQL